jgi:uncharacterized protein (DUF433 family)
MSVERDKMTESSPTVLDREMFTEAAAARFLQMAPSSLHYWLEGGERRGKTYPPVVRAEPTGNRTVTWAEFIELGLLRQYRSKHQVPMRQMRATIEILRESLGVPYPLAHVQPFVGEGRQLLSRAQDQAKLPSEFCLVAIASGQLVLTPASDAFFERVDWDDDLAVAWKPHKDPGSPVRMNPTLRFGLPAVGGVKTSTIWEHLQSGESSDEVAEVFDLSKRDVQWAAAYENSVNAA